MFGDETFSGFTFSDFFNVNGSQIFYVFRKGRTSAVAISPENGNIITDIELRIIRTKVEALKTRNTSPQTGF